ncbi:AAA family ATPase, partial [Thiocapsa sp.]|uniref:AAA family ATPase n=1 Tax=Thiocapsa sp. TaxID=2024551 RepID=UPI0025EE601F
LGQGDLDSAQEARNRATCTRYLELAESYIRPRSPRLLIACGLSGSGKSYMARRLREALPLIHLRSDIERKRLFGISETMSTRASLDAGIYFPTATDWTYARLLRLAEAILGYGYDVLVDATFICAARRALFWDLARRHCTPVAILALDAPVDVLRNRIICRRAENQDVSEADVRVLERQRLALEPLASDERAHAVFIDTSRTPPLAEVLERIESAFVSVLAPTEQ